MYVAGRAQGTGHRRLAWLERVHMQDDPAFINANPVNALQVYWNRPRKAILIRLPVCRSANNVYTSSISYPQKIAAAHRIWFLKTEVTIPHDAWTHMKFPLPDLVGSLEQCYQNGGHVYSHPGALGLVGT